MSEDFDVEEMEELPSTNQNSAQDEARVYRLPNFDMDGRADQLAEKEFLIALPAKSNFEQVIKKLFGAGDYRVEVRRRGRFVSSHEVHLSDPDVAIREREVITSPHVEEPGEREGVDVGSIVKSAVEAALKAQAQANVQGAQNQTRSFEQMREALNLVREMREVSDALAPTPAPVQPVAPAPVAEPEPLSLEQAVLKILASDEDALGDVAARLLDREHEQTTFADVFKPLFSEAAKNLPLILQTVATVTQGGSVPQNTRRQNGAAPGATNGAKRQPPAQAHVEPESVQPIAGEVEENPIIVTLTNIVADLYEDRDVDEAADDLIGFIEDFPEHEPTVSYLLTLPAQSIIAAIKQQAPGTEKFVDVAHAEKWVDTFRDVVNERRERAEVVKIVAASLSEATVEMPETEKKST